MAFVISTKLRNFIAEMGSWKDALDNCEIAIYSGPQPSLTTADLAPIGNLLATLTLASGTKTDEVSGLGILTLSGTTSGSVDTVTLAGVDILGGAVTHDGSHTTTAAAVCTKINRSPSNKHVRASNVAGVITLTALPGMGATLNGATLTFTATTCTAAVTSTTFASGTGGGTAGVTPVNGLTMDVSVDGVMQKNSSEVWSGLVVGAGTQIPGWFRIKGSVADDDSLDSTNKLFIRMDGAIASSGSQMNLPKLNWANGETRTLTEFSLTVPAV